MPDLKPVASRARVIRSFVRIRQFYQQALSPRLEAKKPGQAEFKS